MKEEICKICGKNFYKKYPRDLTCSKECSLKNQRINHRRNSKLWVFRHPQERKEICHKYSINNREKLRLKAKEWRKKNPEKVITLAKEWRKNNKLKRNAQATAQRNIKIKGLCQVCNKNLATHRHHLDYLQPLNIMLVCAKCHKGVHVKQ